jgi:hypothetical protein
MPEKYINPFTDFGFKKIFGEELSFLKIICPQPKLYQNTL